MLFLFYLSQLNISQKVMHILIHVFLIRNFKVNLQQQFIGNLSLVACIPILIVF